MLLLCNGIIVETLYLQCCKLCVINEPYRSAFGQLHLFIDSDDSAKRQVHEFSLWKVSAFEQVSVLNDQKDLSIWTGVSAQPAWNLSSPISAIKAEPEVPRKQLIFNFLSSSTLSQVNFLYLEFSLYFIRNKESRTLGRLSD